MSNTQPQAPIDLHQLLEQFRSQGLTVGADEYVRLHHIFKAQPALSRIELRDLLCTVLAKSGQQRQQIERLFRHLVPEDYDTQLLPADAKPSANTHVKPSANTHSDSSNGKNTKKHPKKLRNYRQFGLWVLLAVILAIAGSYKLISTLYPPETPKTISTESTTDANKTSPLPKMAKRNNNTPFKLIETVPVWSVASITIVSRNIFRELLPLLLLLTGAGLGFIWLFAKAWGSTRQREPDPLSYDPKAKSYFNNPALKQAYSLFSPQQQSKMAWGISHYQADNNTQQIDIERSVQASARLGLPEIHFKHSQHERSVWLWQDRLSDNPLQASMCKDIEAILNRLQITVKHGFFNQLPHCVTDRQGRVIADCRNTLPQHQPLVLVCLNAPEVNDSFKQYPHETRQTFHYLKQWQQLAVVDCSNPISSLKHSTKAYQLNYLLPTHIPEWFASQGQVLPHAATNNNVAQLYRWACACALIQRVVRQDEACALHHELGLNCHWRYTELGRYGQVLEMGGGIDFRKHQIDLINHLSDDDRMIAQRFWQKRLKTIDQYREKEDTNWQDSHARHEHIILRRSLLQLWNTPDKLSTAVNKLADIHQYEPLKNTLKQHLGQYSCQGLVGVDPDKPTLQLPYQWEQLNATLQQQLLTMGFAGQLKQTTLRWDTTTHVILGLLAGLICFSAYQSITVLTDQEATYKTHIASASPPKVVATIQQDQLFIGTPHSRMNPLNSEQRVENSNPYTLNDNQIAEIHWSRQIKPAQEVLKSDDAELWRLGTKRHPVARNNPIAVSLAIIKAKPSDKSARQLAALLLDSGSADQVLLSEKWRSNQTYFKNWADFPDSATSEKQVQRLYIGIESVPSYITTLVANTAVYKGSAHQLLSQLENQPAGQQDLSTLGFETHGNPYLNNIKTATPIVLKNGLTLMPIPTGSFQMGSNEVRDNEKPVHTVTISQPFWMGQTEVTFDQYNAYTTATGKPLPDDEKWGKGNRPVINVKWDDAQGYVNWLTQTNEQGLQCRLPSEAEWEYAARAGTTTAYYWGDQIGNNNANCNRCGSKWGGKQTAPVASFAANPWGLHDMSGNVDEWVQDAWYDNYDNAPNDGTAWESVNDGTTPASGSFRVLRGGSWDESSSDVRSALRNFSNIGLSYLGFRIVCSPLDR